MPANPIALKLRVDWFFDRQTIENPVEKARVDYLRRAAGQVRLRMRRSMRRRKKVSAPGRPPSIHSPSSQSLRLIQFALDRESGGAIVGPVKFNAKTGRQTPNRLEFGGRSRIVDRRRQRTVRIRRRPFAGPALAATESALGDLWGASLERQFARGRK